ncbi:WD repeat-containing protein 27 [Nephila pilipes]|uniref:WD repeat-containing protein 27 n=1 Tax=Nephila pilipes TaxID=299642 RepID=A0A8X6N353_NEPPI|nr:WD repeat-containing protein 27 [Nephila pilipes]
MPLNERGNIAIWNTEVLSEKPSILIGHHKTVSALALSHQPTCHFLCSCSSDNIILWNLTQNGGHPSKGKVLHSHMEQPIYCSFSFDNSEIAISFPTGIWIFDLKKNSWTQSIEGTCFSIFAFDKRDVLLGIEENFLKTWHIESKETEIKVSVSTGFSTALCIHQPNAIIIIGTTCGHLNIYDMKFTLIRSIQIWKLLAQQLKPDFSEEGTFLDVKSDSFPVYSLQVFNYENFNNPDIYLLNAIYLLVVTSTCLFILEINNEEIIFFADFNDYIVFEEIKTQIGLVRSSATACDADYSKAYVILTPVLDESLILLKLSIRDIVLSKLSTENLKVETSEKVLTFLNSDHTEKGKSLLIPRIQKTNHNKSLRKVSSNMNLPVTFHSNIKSSGYGKVHKPVTLFQPQIPAAHRNKFKNSVSHGKLQNTVGTKKRNMYEIQESLNFENLELLCKKESFENPVLSSLQITADGEYVSCTSSKGLLDIFKVREKNLNLFRSITAHKEKINAAKWSHSKQLLVTAGNDKIAKIWDLEKQYPLLTIGVENSLTAKEKDAVQQIQFYYLDHFILAAAGNKLHLFEYAINIQKSVIKSYLNTSSLKLIKKIPLDTKRITSLAAMNQFFSNILFESKIFINFKFFFS